MARPRSIESARSITLASYPKYDQGVGESRDIYHPVASGMFIRATKSFIILYFNIYIKFNKFFFFQVKVQRQNQLFLKIPFKYR